MSKWKCGVSVSIPVCSLLLSGSECVQGKLTCAGNSEVTDVKAGASILRAPTLLLSRLMFDNNMQFCCKIIAANTLLCQ